MKLHKIADKKNRLKYSFANYYTKDSLDRSLVLFESFHGKEISDTPLAMAKAFLEMPESKGCRLYFSSNDTARDRKFIDSLGLDIEVVHIHSNEYTRLLATAGYLINNSSFPSYYVRRDGQTYLQTWHGTPWKTLGKSMKGGLQTMHNAQHNFLQASHLLFPNEFTRDAIMRDYNLENLYTGKVLLHGYPRNSIFCDSDRAEETKRLCGDEGILTFAYMPTWRGQDNLSIAADDYIADVMDQLRQMDDALSDDMKLYVNLHPIIQSCLNVDDLKHVFTFPTNIDKYEFINSIDVLITDYSSIFFDYSITGKPIILFTYDYDEYVSERGLYFGIEDLPFARVSSTDELIGCIKSGSYKKYDYSVDKVYRDRFIKYDSLSAARDIMRYILGKDDGSVRVEDYSRNAETPRRVIDCPRLANVEELDELASSVGKEDVVVFHQSTFSDRISRHMQDNYKNSFDYIFTTEAVPRTYTEAMSKSSKTKKAVKERNLRRQAGLLNVSSSTSFKPLRISVDSFKMSGSRFHITMHCPESLGTIKDIVLRYRSDVESITHSFDWSAKKEGSRYEIDVSADLSILKHGCVYWDVFVVAEKDDVETEYSCMLSNDKKRLLKIKLYQCVTDGYVTFPHITLISSLAFTHRELSPYDGAYTRLKELATFAFYLASKGKASQKGIWLVFEKFCSAAQDNGYFFFKYCMENLPESEKRRIFFVIDKKSKDYGRLAPYKKNVLQYMSLKHMYYGMIAKVFVGSDSRKHLYVWRAKPNFVSDKMRKKPILFLQHGVTALKCVDHIFGVNGSSPMTHMTATSEYEQDILEKYFGYSKADAPILGFTRWDVLEDKSSPDEKVILVMPTWRAWLEEKTDEDFLASDYFRNYMNLLSDESLADCLREGNIKLIFFIHPKFSEFLSRFSTDNENVEFISFGEKPLNEIMMHCSMLVTDYSSVCWDVYYMGKPVIFYQFDYDMYMENHGSYLDMEKDLFGDRCTELPELVGLIKKYAANGFTESERAKSMRGKYFAYIDRDNSKRTYEYLKRRGY